MDELVKLNSRPEFREYMSVEEDERKIHNSLLQSSYNEGKTDGKLEGIQEGIKEGIQEGIKEGIQEGKKEEKRSLAINLLKENIDINIISRTTGLSIEQLLELKDINK